MYYPTIMNNLYNNNFKNNNFYYLKHKICFDENLKKMVELINILIK